MPIKIRDLDGGIGNIILGSGVLTGDEYVHAIKTHLSQNREKFKRYRYCLSDYTEVVDVDIHQVISSLLQSYAKKPQK